ncbi:FYN-binding protein-like isoform X2 [Limulus polyphemus]|nr:FYN-binding protein-like isoform X2 [Limulus polyphemus]
MVDSSPQAKVQELKALFSRTNSPVMGLLSAQKSVQNLESKASSDTKKFSPSNYVYTSSQPQKLIENAVSTGPINSENSFLSTKTYVTTTPNGSTSSMSSDSGLELSPGASNKQKMCAGTKASRFVKHVKSLSSSSVGTRDNKIANTTCTVKSTDSVTTQSTESITLELTEEMDKQKKANDFAKVVNQELDLKFQVNPTLPLVSFTVKPFKKQNGSTMEKNKTSNVYDIHCDPCTLTNSEKYVCKSHFHYQKKELPSLEKLGNPPLKLPKPPNVQLPVMYRQTIKNRESPPPLPSRSLPLPAQKSVQEVLQKRKRLPPCIPTLELSHSSSSHPEPVPAVTRKKLPSLPDNETDIEELYDDTTVNDRKSELTIPEYTEEQESNDTDMHPPPIPSQPPPARPRYAPLPPVPSDTGFKKIPSLKELYKDSLEQPDEDVYEEMPVYTLINEEWNGPIYGNRREEMKYKREEDKQRKRDQKKKEKEDRELEKLRKKFSITGNEVPIDFGIVSCDSKGGRLDLSVKKGEPVKILRMENNPSGKWLVSNERGKIGYVELTSIQIENSSKKSVVMAMQNTDEELYHDVEIEAIYEETY